MGKVQEEVHVFQLTAQHLYSGKKKLPKQVKVRKADEQKPE